MAREGEPKALRELLETLVAGRGWGERLAAGRLRDEWAAVVGEQVAAHSEPLKLVRGVLTLRAESGAWATELSLLARSLAGRIDAHLGGGVVREVKIVAGEARGRP
ncbi:MAG: DUF721 domain-containing protein [Acidobacteria bacterium]|nr:DUF721 domain-containing protein [Acidobacteriota bacterium]